MLYDNEQVALRHLRAGLEEGHIEAKQLREKIRNVTRTATVYQITGRGIAYLCDSKKLCWFDELEKSEIKKLVALKNEETGQGRRRKISFTARAALMSASAGAELPREMFCARESNGKSEDDAKRSIAEFCRDNLDGESCKNLCGQLFEKCGGLPCRYIHAAAVKQNAANLSRGENNHPDYDFRRGRNRGIVESSAKAILLYCAGAYGFRWISDQIQKDIEALNIWLETESIAGMDTLAKTKTCGAILVENPRQFEWVISNHAKEIELKRQQKCGGEEIRKKLKQYNDVHKVGSDFTHFYVLPECWEGADLLHTLLQSSDSELDGQIFNLLRRLRTKEGKSVYYENDGDWNDIFPWETDGGIQVLNLCEMDLNRMYAVRKVLECDRASRFGIIVLFWQEEYLERMFPPGKYPNLRFICLEQYPEIIQDVPCASTDREGWLDYYGTR